MSAFNMERLHNSALCLGLAEAAYDEAVTFAETRKSFGRPIVEFQSVYHSLADMWVKLEAQRLLAYRAGATARDGRFPDAHDVTVAKLHGSKMMVDVTLASLELHGGYGVTLDYPIQRIHRDAISSVVAGGAPAVLRNSVASMILPHRRFSQMQG
jgi:butyryl-CoA dehydrogenase